MAVARIFAEETMQLLLTDLFPGARLIVAANRAPFRRVESQHGATLWQRPAGGVTAALDPLLRETGGVWFAAESGSEQDLAVPPEEPSYRVLVLGVPEDVYRGYYTGYANSGLWPLCHNLVERAHFHSRDWISYRQVNRMFAARIASVASAQDLVFVHDYQLALVPGYLRQLGYKGPIAHFWHIPWPPAVVLRLLPERRLLLQGLLQADWLGFQTQESVDAFASAAMAELGVTPCRDGHGLSLTYEGHVTRLAAAPISIDIQKIEELAATRLTQERMVKLREHLALGQEKSLLLGVDRLDYTKGIPARLEGYATLLSRYPSLVGKVQFLQIAVPTRTEISDYRRLAVSVRRRARELNRRFGLPSWPAVRLIEHNLRLDQLVALYRISDVAVVSSLYDGLNLVAKEYVAARIDEGGALCLSETAGAYEELPAAFPLSPLSSERVAESLARALFAPVEERKQRMRSLRAAVTQNTVHTWLGRVLSGVREATLIS
jgi:trehalose 6-phosphate synthase